MCEGLRSLESQLLDTRITRSATRALRTPIPPQPSPQGPSLSLPRGAALAARPLPPSRVPISLRSFSPILAATSMPPRGRLTLVVLSPDSTPAASSSDSSLSSASSCDAAAACRSLALAASPASRRNSALLAAYFGPSSLSSSPRARTTLLTPTPIICRQVMSLLRSTLVSNTCTSTHSRRHRFVFRSPYVRRGSPSMP